jgi:adenosylcobinamide-phosphate synthase
MTPWPVIIGAFFLDSLLGDPVYSFHPARLMGKAADFLEPRLRKRIRSEIAGGLAGWIIIVGTAVAAGFILPGVAAALGRSFLPLAGSLTEGIAAQLPEFLADAVSAILIYTTIAARDMAKHALAVTHALSGRNNPQASPEERLEAGRAAVSRIVGRDVERLDEAGVIRATIESVAESTIDGVIAPLFWAIIAGAPGALAYRAINTLDSLWGHRNERYLRFGRIAARADDLANWLPARLGFACGLLALIPLSIIAPARFNLRAAALLGWRDRRAHESPNSAWMEALTAGALGLRLAGPAWYSGHKLEKPWIGEPRREPTVEDIDRSLWIMYATTSIMIIPFYYLSFLK